MDSIKALDTAVVILNFNGKHLLEQLIPITLSNTQFDKTTQLIVVDNDSTDDSMHWLSNNYPDISIIRLDQNYGFTGGYNKALAQIDAKYFVLLSSDVEVGKHWLPPLINCLKRDASIAVCQPKVRSFYRREEFEYAGAAGGYLDSLGMPFCRGRMFSSIEKDIGQYDNACEIFWASGCCFVVKQEVWRDSGGFDEDFFAHMEEIDLCWRIKDMGYSVYVEPKSTVYHMGGETLSYNHPKKLFLNFRNNYAMLTKNLILSKLFLLLPLRMLIDLMASLYFLQKNGWKAFVAILKAQVHFLWRFSHWYNKREVFDKGSVKQKSFFSNRIVIIDYFLRNKKRFAQLGL